MSNADLVRADQQAMLILGTFVSAQQDPAIWERFTNRLFDQWAHESNVSESIRTAAANQAITALGRLAEGRGTQPGVDAAKAGDNPAPPQATGGGAAASV